MIGIYGQATIVLVGKKISMTVSALLAAIHAPVLAAFLAGMVLLLITVLALTAALSKKQPRRAAAYKVLKLILQTIRRSRSRLS